MLHTPHPPHVLTTLQIECVACKQPFLVAEAETHPSLERESLWRLISSTQPYVNLRYTADNTCQPTQPPPRPHTQREISSSGSPNSGEKSLNCPRCAADNRNWLHVLHGQVDGRSVFWSWWARLRKYPFALVGMGIALLLTLVVIGRFSGRYEEGSLGVLAAAVFLAGFLPCYFGTRTWSALREYRNGRGYLPDSPRISPPLKRILIIGAIFLFILPGFLYVVMPLGFDFASELISPTEPPTLPARINNAINEMGPTLRQPPDGKVTRAEDAIGTLERILGITPEAEATLYQRSQTALAAARDRVKQRPESEITGEIAAEIRTLENFIGDTKPPRVDTSFLKTWFKYTMTSHVLASIFALLAVSRYVAGISRQLPRPLFHSVSDMVRVVQWEVQRSLEVDGDMRHVQWMDVTRNEIGGIDMMGLHRAAPEFENGRPVGTTVRAQQYEVRSDAWGRLIYAEVRDVRAPISAVSPEHVAAAGQWPAPQPASEPLQTPARA